MTASKRYICHTYRHAERGKGVARQLVLVQASAIECKSSAEAEARAQRMFDGGSFAGADAFSIEVVSNSAITVIQPSSSVSETSHLWIHELRSQRSQKPHLSLMLDTSRRR